MVTAYNQKKGTPGRKRKPVDWDEAKRMRDRYKRIGEIATHFGVDIKVISNGLKMRGIK